jgi:hypothetical protein
MAISLRITTDKEELINRYAKKTGKTKTAVILEAVDEKLGLAKSKPEKIKNIAGWMSHEEAESLRKSIQIFRRIHDGDWE